MMDMTGIPGNLRSRLLQAHRFIDADQPLAAEKMAAEVLAEAPHSSEAYELLAEAAAARRGWAASLEAAHKAVEVGGSTRKRQRLIGTALRHMKSFAEAEEILLRVIEEQSTDHVAQDARKDLVVCLQKLRRWEDAAAVARDGCAVSPGEAQFKLLLGETLARMGQDDDAERELRAALEIDPTLVAARAILQTLRLDITPTKRRRWAPWPSRVSLLADLRDYIKRNVLRGYPGCPPFVTPTTSFMTLGSCFARNLALRLRASGLPVHAEFIGEEINSTYANRYLLSWVERGVHDGPTQVMADAYGEPLRQRMRDGIVAADVVVLTLGVAPSFFDKETGDFFFTHHNTEASQFNLLNNYAMRTTTVGENVANIKEMMQTIRRISDRDPKIVLTVSPVPLGATAEMESPVIADCISKSVMRLACHEILSDRTLTGVHYWPSFEMVRWLGAHIGHHHPPAYGLDDQNSRHVSSWIVALVVDLFLETYGAPQPAAAQADAPSPN